MYSNAGIASHLPSTSTPRYTNGRRTEMQGTLIEKKLVRLVQGILYKATLPPSTHYIKTPTREPSTTYIGRQNLKIRNYSRLWIIPGGCKYLPCHCKHVRSAYPPEWSNRGSHQTISDDQRCASSNIFKCQEPKLPPRRAAVPEPAPLPPHHHQLVGTTNHIVRQYRYTYRIQ